MVRFHEDFKFLQIILTFVHQAQIQSHNGYLDPNNLWVRLNQVISCPPIEDISVLNSPQQGHHESIHQL